MWRNDIKCKYMFMFSLKYLACKGVSVYVSPSNQDNEMVPRIYEIKPTRHFIKNTLFSHEYFTYEKHIPVTWTRNITADLVEMWPNGRWRNSTKFIHIPSSYFIHLTTGTHIVDFHQILTHWGRVTHICVIKLTIIGSDKGLSPGWRHAII